MKLPGFSLPKPSGEGVTVPFLSAAAVQRLCIDLISAEQQRLIRERRISSRQRIETYLAGRHPDEERLLEIGEDALGLDSLMLLDVVGVVSRYFALADSGAEDLLLVHRTLGDWSQAVVAHFERVGAGARIVFETSGSAGDPKRIAHSSSHLMAEVDEHLGLWTPPRLTRVVTAVPPRHIYGFLWSVLLPQVAGVPVIDVHHSAGEFLSEVCRPGDLVIGTPFSWERAAAGGRRLPPNVAGVTSGGPSTHATWYAAEALGLDRFVEIYGSTETGGVGWRVARNEPFSLSQRFVRRKASLLRRSTREVIAVQDSLSWHTDDKFEVGPRLDGMVQVAGVNISLTAVAAVLRSVDGVADAVARLDGLRIKALVIPKSGGDDHELLEYALRARAARDLPAPARPDRYLFEAALPVNSMGKPSHW